MAALPQLERLGLTVYVSEPRMLGDIANSIRDFGILAGTEAVAEHNAEQFERDIDSLQKSYGGQPAMRAFYQIWNDPLQTINGQHMISQVMTLCGGSNVFAGEQQLTPG